MTDMVSSDTLAGPRTLSGLGKRSKEYFAGLQAFISESVQTLDGRGVFGSDPWEHPGGGGGLTRVLEDGAVFEKAGVNISSVWGPMPEEMARRMNIRASMFFAAGISMVIHPQSPMIPTLHANLRYFEQAGGDAWFGGGSDLTPYYPFDEDIVHFHRTLKQACDRNDPGHYRKFKKCCDEYFRLAHRNEGRGVGGIFFDYLRGSGEEHFSFVRSVGDALLDAYLPIVRRRIAEPWGERERTWQLQRRGRYAEFNLLYDRGTAFGLQTGGRVESILMSLPPLAGWAYDVHPEPGSPEARLVELLQHPREWV